MSSLGLNIGQEAHRLGSLAKGEQDSLEKAVIRILAFHVGRENAISGSRMLFELQSQGLKINETKVFRDVINKLRKEQWPIGSTGGIKGGYWICKDQIELDQVLKAQFHDFAMDMLEQEKAMRAGAKKFFGNQLSIYG